jgi:hypothetical protein
MAPAQVVLTPSELQTASRLLQSKPPTISQEQFDAIKSQVFSGVPQAEYILVSNTLHLHLLADSSCPTL